MRGAGGGEGVGGDVGEEVCEDEINTAIPFFSCLCCGPVGRGAGDPKGFVDLLFNSRGGTAGAGAEVDEGVGGEGGAEYFLEDAGHEGCGGGGLEGGCFEGPAKGEAVLDAFAEELGEAGGEVSSVEGGKGGKWLATRAGHRFRRGGGGGWGGEAPLLLRNR